MKTCLPIPVGSLLAGAAALCLTAAIAVGQDTEAPETNEAAEMNALPSAQAIDRISDHFSTFAGSEANATALVTGLVNGTAISLSSTANGQTTTTTITPPAGTMGAGNAFLSLALAEAELTKLGITQPTAADIRAALTGGSVTTGSGSTAVTTQLQGVLVLRNQGQGFGQIAQTLGVNMRTAIMAAHAAGDAGEAAEAGQPEEAPMHQLSVQSADRIADHFVTFAGSENNANALVKGLVDGTAITLTSTANGQTTTTTITPPTGPMSGRSALTALALAEADLTKLGDTQPTAADIQAALTGGSVTTGSGSTAVTTKLQGVLVLRTQGQTFGQIAQTLGVNLQTALANARAATDSGETAEAGKVEELTKAQGRATDRIADHFTKFAGSEDNATALVNGLRNGTAVSLTSTVNGQTVTTTFAPTTGQMGYGNVFLALALAQEDLTKLGITQPTAAEIQAALEGGSVTTGSGSTAVTTQLTGVLVLRSQGQTFSQIAQTLGVSLQTAIADARAGTDANEAAEAEHNWHHTASADAPKAMADARSSANASASAVREHDWEHSTSRPDVAASANRPSVSLPAQASAQAAIATSARPPQIPVRPEVPRVPERPEIPHVPQPPGRH